jgi:hypothetical protein
MRAGIVCVSSTTPRSPGLHPGASLLRRVGRRVRHWAPNSLSNPPYTVANFGVSRDLRPRSNRRRKKSAAQSTRCKRGELNRVVLCAQLGERLGVWLPTLGDQVAQFVEVFFMSGWRRNEQHAAWR